MEIRPSQVISRLGGYAFDEIDKQVARLRADGIKVIDFGVGDPQYPTPQFIRDAARDAVDNYAASGYPSYVGAIRLRRQIADWMEHRFGVALDADREIAVTLGSKEAVFHFPLALLDPGDIVLIPSPGYPPYRTGTLFAGGEPWYYPVTPANSFLPDFESVPEAVLKRTRLLWLNYPHSPTGANPPDDFYRAALEFAHRHNIVIAADEAYSELYFGTPPRSILEFGTKGVIVFQSLSKRSAMTGYRIGWVCGDEALVSLFKKLKTNIDSGSPEFVQEAAMAALDDEDHVEAARKEYGAKAELLLSAFGQAGLPARRPEGTIFLWQPVPQGMTDVEYARRLLSPELACAVMPGSWLATPLAAGANPGDGHVRWALCPPPSEVEEAARRIAKADF